ncbi:MAG: hypothetical protein D6707_05660 [Bacteroidetes bacterium]|nr:MAG: hypothetical protein D6707_05660 [Bacteroidota bacterium]
MKKLAFILPIFLLTGFLYAQKKVEVYDEDKLKHADQLFETGKYEEAIPYYEELMTKYGEVHEWLRRTGICYIFKPDEVEKSIEYLEKLLHKKPKKIEDYYYWLGRAYHINYRFDDAINAFNQALDDKNKTNADKKQEIPRWIEYCNNGKELVANKYEDITVRLVMDSINTEWDEYRPVITPDEQMMIITYRGEKSKGGLQNKVPGPFPSGEYLEDVFVAYNKQTYWTEPKSISDKINDFNNNACVSLSQDGKVMYLYSDEDGTGDLFYSHFKNGDWTYMKKFPEPVNTYSWESSASISADGKTMYFVSDRPGGKGGRDIFMSQLQPDSSWSEPVSLPFNTEYDEDCPYIHADGITLYFSSKGYNSMGGYDIFRTTLQPDGTWTAPVNLGYPINTPGDDIYFVVGGSGETGYYSSARKGGKGKHDIYQMNLSPLGYKHGVLKVNITAQANSTDTFKLQIITTENDTVAGRVFDKQTVVYLPLKNSYTFIVACDTLMQQENIDVTQESAYTEKTLTFDFTTPIAEAPQSVSITDTTTVEQQEPETINLSATTVVKAEDEIQTEAQEPIETFTPEPASEGMIFTVQIAAYRLPDNFDYSALSDLGKIDKRTLNDGITRFTIGNFSNLEQAQKLKQQVIERGITDAFITVYVNGERKLLNEVLNNQ